MTEYMNKHSNLTHSRLHKGDREADGLVGAYCSQLKPVATEWERGGSVSVL